VQPEKIIVIGFGNPLMGDDGVGPKAIERLLETGLPAGVKALDGGTRSLIYKFPLAELRPMARGKISLHSLDLIDAAHLWELQLGRLPEILVFGIEPGSTQLGMEFTPAVAAALPKACELVREEVKLRLNS